jgi:ABC-type lipoprotein release transport system permease subunit
MTSTSTRYALRSLRRNARRTLLSVAGLAFGVGVGLMAISWVTGLDRMAIDGVATAGLGHVRIVPTGWNEHRDDAMRLTDGDAVLARVRGTDGIAIATPRARIGGLLGIGTRSAHVTLTGVDPETEALATRYVREGIAEGRYLQTGEEGAIVVGRTIAERLHAELGDELVVTCVDDEGEMQSALVAIVGIIATGSHVMDASIAHVSLADVARLSGREGISEIAMIVDDTTAIDALRDTFASGLPEGDEALTWLELSPEFRSRIASGRAFMRVAIAVVLLVVLLGVASAQLTGVLERRKEFAVLAALGMRGVSLVRIVVTEGLILGGLGALTALAWTAPILHDWSTNGIDLTPLFHSRDGVAFAGVLLDPMYYPSYGAWAVSAALGLSLVATVLASLYPAWFASRSDPASALRVDR